MTKICAYCGKEFEPSGRNKSRQKYCKGPHYNTCEVCGKVFEVHNINEGISKTCSVECRNKLKILKLRKTIKDRYDVDNVSKVPEIRKKINISLSAKSKETKKKRDKTMLQRYGVKYSMQCSELRQKIFQTNQSKYGCTNPAKNADIRAKISEKTKSEEYKSKYSQTSISHYGVPRPAQSLEVQLNMQATCLKKYGVRFSSQTLEARQKISTSIRQVFSKNPEIMRNASKTTSSTCQQRYNVNWPCQLSQCRNSKYRTNSKTNEAFSKILDEYEIEYESEFPISDYSYDFHILDTNILIEIDPTYTHSSHPTHFNFSGKDKNYHLNKSKTASENEYRCIHVFDWDDKYLILNSILPKKSIGARSCSVKEISSQLASEFEKKYHIQGSCRNQRICLGLMLNGELVSIMTFGEPRYNKKYEYELLRLCTKSGLHISGGPSKLFKYFIKNYAPDSVISYCDRSKFEGHVYDKIGMTLVTNTPPQEIWSKGTKNITANLLRQRGYDQLFNTNYGKGTSNEQLMIDNGWLPIYDCGQIVYKWCKDLK